MRYQFGDFELATERYELRRNGIVLHIEPLVFDLIQFLLRHAGRVVSRDEIVEGVWQGRLVSEATIDGCVKLARRVLGDSGDNQSFIRTVRGRGFEFAAPVTVRDQEQSSVSVSQDQTQGDIVGSRATQGGGVVKNEAALAGHSASADGTPLGTAPRPVLAVFPFSNQSGAADDYFSDGLTEDIVTNLSRFRDLRVIAAGSTLQFKGCSINVPEFCREMRAGYVVQGSVRRAVGRVRITVQLIDGVSCVQLWGERYDREMGDIFDLQDELTRRIAATLGVKLQDVSLERAMAKGPLELDSYDCVLRARRYTSALSAEMHAEARDLLERAVELDPLSSDAHALLANVYLAEHRFEMNPRPDPIGRALTHALRATELDPRNAYARCWLAVVHFFRGENEKFETESQLALRLNPNDPETLADIGHYLAFMGEFERGVELSRRAQELNPLHPGWYYFSFARRDYNRKEYEDAIRSVGKIGLPNFYWTHLLDAAAKGQLSRPDAGKAWSRILEIKPNFSPHLELRKWNASPDDRDHIIEGLRRAGWSG
ncbi:MAG TPA: winged helix-turn-helix domain-containing tetratricopeptide repeat protein [Bryobacteraceae bacterium]|nr:winged helix-turn-helix domain-containing tetratricopeptide repeat protein [Bryobacteraceae bacterium]